VQQAAVCTSHLTSHTPPLPRAERSGLSLASVRRRLHLPATHAPPLLCLMPSVNSVCAHHSYSAAGRRAEGRHNLIEGVNARCHVAHHPRDAVQQPSASKCAAPLPNTSHATRHTPYVTRHTSHATRHTPHAKRHTSHVTRHTSHATRHTSHATRHTPHVTRRCFRGSCGDKIAHDRDTCRRASLEFSSGDPVWRRGSGQPAPPRCSARRADPAAHQRERDRRRQMVAAHLLVGKDEEGGARQPFLLQQLLELSLAVAQPPSVGAVHHPHLRRRAQARAAAAARTSIPARRFARSSCASTCAGSSARPRPTGSACTPAQRSTRYANTCCHTRLEVHSLDVEAQRGADLVDALPVEFAHHRCFACAALRHAARGCG
jgi:hypothetical protein